MQDFSEYLVGEKLLKEETGWSQTKHYETYATIIKNASRMFGLGRSFTLLEIGCGSGWIPTVLPESITYLGVDKSSSLLELARKKNNKRRQFFQQDIREFRQILRTDLVCSFAVLKHFGLHEWRDIFRSMLRLGEYGVFSIQVAEKECDDGKEYHHVWVTEGTIRECVAQEERRIYATEDLRRSGYDKFFYIGRKKRWE